MKLIVIGGTGQVGHEVVQQAKTADLQVTEINRDEFDLATESGLLKAKEKISTGADAIIDAQAYTAVDDAEKNQSLCFRLNSEVPKQLALTAAKLRIPYFWLSTDYVFDGHRGPYRETDVPHPLSIYGESKVQGEIHVMANGGRVVRTAWVYSERRKNFLLSILKAAMERPELRVVDDQIGNPTTAHDCAADILTLAQQAYRNGSGLAQGRLVHIAGRDTVSRHRWAELIVLYAKNLGFPIQCERILAIPSSELHLPAARPLDSRLSRERATQLFQELNIRSLATDHSLEDCIQETLLLVKKAGGLNG